jgi:mannose-1-phosphate guanylyltransferase/phosphomannomutase
MSNQVIIIAGGKATRLQNELGDLPKSLAKIGNSTILDYQLHHILKSKINSIHFCLGYKSDIILKYLDFNYPDLHFTYSIEYEPLGTYGALLNSMDFLEEDFFVLLGDIFTDFNINFGFNRFRKKSADVMLVTRYTDHPFDSDLIITNKDGRVVNIKRSTEEEPLLSIKGNTGLLYMKKDSLISTANTKSEDIVNDFIKNNLKKLDIVEHFTTDYIKDVGTEDRLNEQRKKIKFIGNEPKKLACLIDRDETIIFDQGNSNEISKIRIKPYAIRLINYLKKYNIKIILITNQPGVAKGFFTIEELELFHLQLQKNLISKKSKPIDAIYYCPHHPEKGFEDEVIELKITCTCRKPKTGLVYKAMKELNLQDVEFFLIGDTKNDYLLSKNLEIDSYIVKSKFTELDYFNKINKKVFSNLNHIKKELEASVFSRN